MKIMLQFFRMKTVVDILLASGALSIIKWLCSVVVGIIIINNYWIMKGANRGSRSRRVQMIRRMRSDRRGNRRSLWLLKRRREQRQVRRYDWWRRTHLLMLAVISSHVDDWLKNIVDPVKTGFFKGCFCEFVKKIEFV